MRIKSIKPAGIEPVYNMTVEEFHNYLIHGGIILKNCDAARYFAITRTLQPEMAKPAAYDDDFDYEEDYDEAMTGGEMDSSYLYYGGDL